MFRLAVLCISLFISQKAWADDSAHIRINIPERMLYLYSGSEILEKFPVAVGEPSFKTPVGQKKMDQIVWNPWWYPPKSKWAKEDEITPPGPKNPLGPVKMKLGSTIMLHGTSRQSTVGTPASHGCMRLLNQHAQKLAWWIQNRFTTQTDPTLLAKYQEQKSESFYVPLKRTLSVSLVYEPFEKIGEEIKIHPDVYERLGNRKKAFVSWLKTRKIELDEDKINYLIQNSTNKTAVISLIESKKFKPNLSKDAHQVAQDIINVKKTIVKNPSKHQFSYRPAEKNTSIL